MATTTDNYGLTKPLSTDYYDIEIQNGNMDAIDQALKENVDGVASEAVARAEADDTLQDNLDAEILARVAADTALQTVATQAANGMMSAADKAKLDGVAVGANNYVHPTTAGNKHIPAGGATNQLLKYSAAGTAVWENILADIVGLSAATQAKYGVTNVDAALDSLKTPTVVEIKTSGNWMVPSNVKTVDLFLVDGGKNGNNGVKVPADGTVFGRGGDGGKCLLLLDFPVSPGEIIPVVIGTSNGGLTSFKGINTSKNSANAAGAYGGVGQNGDNSVEFGFGPTNSNICPFNNVVYGITGAGGGGLSAFGKGGNCISTGKTGGAAAVGSSNSNHYLGGGGASANANGGNASSTVGGHGANASANTGNGGGGGGNISNDSAYSGGLGGSGGSGILLIRYWQGE